MALTAEINELIDKVDNVEQIRDQIACILAIEATNQVALATAAPKPTPQEWALAVFIERSNPFEKWLNEPTEAEKLTPIINVWFDAESFEKGASNVMERQRVTATFNIDVYGYGEAISLPGGGFSAADENAARASQRGVRLSRNILMSSFYTYLKLQGLVSSRWIQSITQFQPEIDGNPVQNVIANRIAFQATFDEFSPQVQPVTLEFLSVGIHQASDGMLIAEVDFDYT